MNIKDELAKMGIGDNELTDDFIFEVIKQTVKKVKKTLRDNDKNNGGSIIHYKTETNRRVKSE